MSGDPLAPVRPEAARSADPAGALQGLERWGRAAGPRAAEFLSAAGAPRALTTLLALGDAPVRALVRDPEALVAAMAGPARPAAGLVEERLRAALGSTPGGGGEFALRRAHRRELLRILLADAGGCAPLETVTGALSDLAEATLRAVLDRESAAAAERNGPPYHLDGTPAALTCIALGKLGGGELNYSSDVDLLFLTSGEGACRPEGGPPGRTLHEHWTSVAKSVARLLSRATEEGHLYRVDLRLRPRGSAGSVAPRAASAVHYYRSFGRGWERQMLLKARPVAGNRSLGATFLQELEPWVYGRPLLSAEIAEIRRLKRAMEERRDAVEENLKTGPGGIRDVEYVVQFLQLLLGAEHPDLRTGNTLEGLRRLAAGNALSAGEAEELAASYGFHRLAEHRLQAADDIQIHTLPREDAALALLARRMGLGGESGEALAEFRSLRTRHAAAARAGLDHLVHDAFAAEEERARRVVDLLLAPGDPVPEDRAAALDPFGFADPARAFADLRRMARARSPWLPRTTAYFASAAPALLGRAAATPDPDRALSLLQRLSERAAGSGLFYRLLTENSDVLGVFCDLGGHSPWLSDLLWSRPTVMDAFLEALVVAPRGGLPPFEDLPLAGLAESDDPRSVLTDLRDLEFLRIGIRDLQGKANARQTGRQLTAVAEAVVRLAADAAGARLADRHGGTPPGRFAVLALGRLGAREMAYGSDLDVLFVHDGEGACPDGTEAAEYWARLGREIVSLLAGSSEHPGVYPVDLRLRPEGRQGTLAVPLQGLLRYQRERARTWEHQALVRARAVGGDGDLGREAMEGIAGVLWGAPPREGIPAEVREMRGRVERAGTAESLKTGRGGVQDAEFLVQALVLAHGHRCPALRRPNTVDALTALRDEGILTGTEYEGMVTAYLFLRTVELRLRLCSGDGGSVLPADDGGRQALARRLGYVDTSYAPAGRSLAEEAAYYRDRMRTMWERVMRREAGTAAPLPAPGPPPPV